MESLWLDEAGPAHPHPPLEESVRADVAVIGAGIAGVTLALTLAQAGASVVLLEAARAGSGVSGATTAKVSALQGAILSQISSRHGSDAVRDYAQASLRAVDAVAELVERHGIDCALERRPAVTYSTEADSLSQLRREFSLAQAAGLDVGWDDRDAGLPFAVEGAIWLEDQLAFQPVRYVRGLLDAFRAAGGRVHEDTRVLSVHDGTPVRVSTGAGEVRADHVAVCTHFPILDRGLLFARLEAQRSYCVGIERGEAPQPRAMAFGIGSGDRSVMWFADELILGGEGHPAGASPQTAGPDRFAALIESARSGWPGVGAVRHRWSAQDPVAFDRLPMIGRLLPRSRRLWVATGWGKWGLTGGTFAAEILAAQIEGRPDPWHGRFSPTRLSPRSTPEIAKLGLGFQAHMVRDRLTPAEVTSPSQVPVGQARVLSHGRTGKLGVYRDGDGHAHAVSLRCSHLGCLLRFNAAETSWDCPCHGSRFGVDGEVLGGPAVHALRRHDLRDG